MKRKKHRIAYAIFQDKEESGRGCRHRNVNAACKYGTYARQIGRITGIELVCVQRYQCHWCHKTFGVLPEGVDKYQRFERLVFRFVLGAKCKFGGCVRKISEFLGDSQVIVKKSTVALWLKNYGMRAGKLLEDARPEVSGFLSMDEIWTRLRKKGLWNYGLLTVDKITHVMLTLRACESKTRETWEKVLSGISWLLFRVKLVSFDLLEGVYPPAIRNVLGVDVKLQPCIFHLHKAVGKHLRDGKVVEEERKKIRGGLSECFRAADAETAGKLLDETLSSLEGLHNVGADKAAGLIRFWRKDLFNYMQFGVSGTNNEVEQAFSQYKPLYWPMKEYQTRDGMQEYFDLVRWHYNNRPFQRGEHAGKSPYELAGLPKANWLDHLGLKL